MQFSDAFIDGLGVLIYLNIERRNELAEDLKVAACKLF